MACGPARMPAGLGGGCRPAGMRIGGADDRRNPDYWNFKELHLIPETYILNTLSCYSNGGGKYITTGGS